MTTRLRPLAIMLATALLASALSGCGTINEKMAAATGDYVPQWAGGLPADAPPRPGTAKYDEFMRERERLRQMPASERPRAQAEQSQQAAQQSQARATPSALDPLH